VPVGPGGAQPAPVTPTPTATGAPGASAPNANSPSASGQAQLNISSSASDQATDIAPNSVAPYMIGDFFICTGQIIFTESNPTGKPGQGIVLGDIPSAGGTARVKISEDNSPIPADRLFFLYNFFQNAIQLPTPTTHYIDIDRYTFGAEKTFFDGQGS